MRVVLSLLSDNKASKSRLETSKSQKGNPLNHLSQLYARMITQLGTKIIPNSFLYSGKVVTKVPVKWSVVQGSIQANLEIPTTKN